MAPQYTMEQRNFLAMEYHKKKGTRGFKDELIQDFLTKFPNARRPSTNHLQNIWSKQIMKGTVLNCNSKSSPGITHSGRRRTVRTDPNKRRVKQVMDRDAVKQLGDGNHSPVSTSRRNALGISRSSWSRIKKDLNYHPYKPVYQQELKPQDYARRRAFSQWVLTLTDNQLQQFLFSDEANFQLCGHVNSQNVRRYAPLKYADPLNGGRPMHFVQERSNYSPKLMVFCGLKNDGAFGLKFYHEQTMNSQRYHSLLQYNVLPELRVWNGGNLDNLFWQQDGAPCHVTARNMQYLDSQFHDRVISRKSLNGRDWPARSPDLNPLDYFLWGYLKSKVYCPKPNTLLELEANIQHEVRRIPAAMILTVILDLKRRAGKCLLANGGYFES